jgi:hypothetical protein
MGKVVTGLSMSLDGFIARLAACTRPALPGAPARCG